MLNYPAMKWHPKTGESQVFKAAEDVPEGWLDHHPDDPSVEKDADPNPPRVLKPALPAADPTVLPMTRDEIKAALDAAEIEYAKNAKDKTLYDLLVTSVKAHLAANDIAFEENADAKQLLSLVPPVTE